MAYTSFSPNRRVRNNTMGGKPSAAIKAIDVTRMLEFNGEETLGMAQTRTATGIGTGTVLPSLPY